MTFFCFFVLSSLRYRHSLRAYTPPKANFPPLSNDVRKSLFIPVIHHFLQHIATFCEKNVFFADFLLAIPKKSTNFALSIENRLEEMNTATLNPSMMHDWEIISADESMMQRLARYMRRLVKEKESDPTLMTKEEFFARVDEAEREIATGECTTFSNKEEMNAWLNSL